MPLPVLTTTTAKHSRSDDAKRVKQPDLQPQKATLKSRQNTERGSEKTVECCDDEIDSSTTIVTDPVTTGQSSSRIPSPLKRHQPDLSTYSQPTKVSQQIQPRRGHIRQKSAAVPPIVPRETSKHARSISTVSTKSTSTLVNNPRVLESRSVNSITQSSRPIKSSLTTTKAVTNPTGSVLKSEYGSLSEEHLRNELFQLSLVQMTSGETLQKYQQNLQKIVATYQAEVQAKRTAVLQLRLAYSAVANISALDSWVKQDGYQDLGQWVQNLSIVVRDVYILEQIFIGDCGLAWAFEMWYKNITIPHEQVTLSQNHDHYIILHISYEKELLPELQRFERRTTPLLAALDNLPHLPKPSSLSFTVEKHVSLLENFRLQCRTMIQVGQHLVKKHREWLDKEISTAVQECKISSGTVPQRLAVGIWES